MEQPIGQFQLEPLEGSSEKANKIKITKKKKLKETAMMSNLL